MAATIVLSLAAQYAYCGLHTFRGKRTDDGTGMGTGLFISDYDDKTTAWVVNPYASLCDENLWEEHYPDAASREGEEKKDDADDSCKADYVIFKELFEPIIERDYTVEQSSVLIAKDVYMLRDALFYKSADMKAFAKRFILELAKTDREKELRFARNIATLVSASFSVSETADRYGAFDDRAVNSDAAEESNPFADLFQVPRAKDTTVSIRCRRSRSRPL